MSLSLPTEISEYEEHQHLLTNNQDKKILVAGPIPKSAWYIITAELCERFAFYGATLMFIPYLTQHLHQSSSVATAINRTFQFFAYFTTLIGALTADLYLGKYKTILLFSIVYFIGLLLLSVSSLKIFIANNLSLTMFCFCVFIFIAWGTGGIKSNVSAYAAEQVPHYTDADLYDYDVTVERVFRYFYWSINVGSLIGQTLCPIIYHKLESIPFTFGLPAAVFFVGTFIFAMGKTKYKTNLNAHNPMKKVFLCIKYSIDNSSPKNTHWLDSAKNNTSLWDSNYVDKLKKTLSATKVFVFYIFYWALYNNMSDAYIIQGTRMKKPNWLPGVEQLNLINSLVLVVCIPIFDMVIFPAIRKRGFKLGPIMRISIGFSICTLAFVYTTILQKYIYNSGPYYDFSGKLPSDTNKQYNDISLYWQIPPYALIAISEIFSSATGLEYAFKFATPELKSVVLSLFLLTNCGGSLIGLVLAIWSYDPNYFVVFGVQSVAMGLMTMLFYYLFRKQD